MPELITFTLRFSKKRAHQYLQTLRKRYNQPNAMWRGLVIKAVKEIVAMEEGKWHEENAPAELKE